MAEFQAAYEVQRNARIAFNVARLRQLVQAAADIGDGFAVKPNKKPASRAPKAPVSLWSPRKTRQMSGTTEHRALTKHITNSLSSLGSKAVEAAPALVAFFEEQHLFTVAAVDELDDDDVQKPLQMPDAARLLTLGVRKAIFKKGAGPFR